MKKGFLKVILRGILHHRLISLITIVGLAIGLAGSIFIGLWVFDELGFDSFNRLGDRLFRVEEDQLYDNGVYHVNVTPWPSGPVWKEKIPEIENSCRITFTGSLLMRMEEKVFNEEKVLAVTPPFSACSHILLSPEIKVQFFGNRIRS